MAWLFISIPVMVLAVAIAVVPVMWQSFSLHRSEHEHRPVAPARTTRHRVGAAPLAAVGVDCPVCAVHIRGVTSAVLVEAVERHAWRFHGIPSAQHITESARVA